MFIRPVRSLSIAVLFFALVPNLLFAAEVRGLRMWPAPDNTRLVFDLSGPVEHRLFTLRQPNRIVIDLENTSVPSALPDANKNQPRIKELRYAKRGSQGLRVVLDLKNSVKPKSFVLKPYGNFGHRLVVDLVDTATNKRVVKKSFAHKKKASTRDLVIAIDAGHGGEDPGAIGQRGTREKDVVLRIAKELEKLVRREPGMKPVMIRNGDYYVGLKNRVKIAEKENADLLISIHADAFENGKARGTSVFILSERGASSNLARYLAASENNSDLSGGDNGGTNDQLLNMVLADMVKNSTLEDSHKIASNVLADLKGVNHLHKRNVEQAGFRVLKSGHPAILVETAFISNRKEEQKLRSPRHQKALARAIFSGTRAYFRSNPVPGTLLAARDRVVVANR